MNDRAKTPQAAKRRRDLFDEAIDIIEREYPAPLTSGIVARRVGASTRNLQRAFTEADGRHFGDHLREIRLLRARALLEQSDLPVKAVAYAVGYRSQAEFAKQFRSRFGHPPSALPGRRRAAAA